MAKPPLPPFLAGAIFTEEEFALIVAIAIAVLLVGVFAFVLFLRSSYRLATREEKSSSDKAVVIIGLLLLMLPAASWIDGAIERAGRGGKEETAKQLINEVTGRPATDFEQGWWHDFHDCSFYKTDIIGAKRNYSTADNLRLNNQTIRTEAALFEASGWEVTRYAATDKYSGFAFRADLDDHALALYEWGGLGYSYQDSSCPARTGDIQSGRVEVAEFPPSG
ncbi:MAG: hypothetical protein EX269_10995 [Acidimicrobiales bacterium]|nr:MAG: hypothetical protein EX269_10995 [Acidimicrobiales bacterium]